MDAPFTLPFPQFWDWLMAHPNCILRAGTPEAVLYDDDDLHWHFAREGATAFLVQVVRGKRLVGELILEPEHITYVEGVPSEHPEEFVFELVQETADERVPAYFFVLVHPYEQEGEHSPARVH